MNIKTIFFLCLAQMTLFFNNKTNAISDGQQFFGLFATVLVGGGVIWYSGAGSKIAENALPQIFGGIATATAVPAGKAIGNIIQKPFINSIDKKIKDLLKEREILSAKYTSLQQLCNPNPNKSNPKELEKLIQATTQQQLALEKKIIKLYEKKAFDKNRVNVIY